MIKINIKIIPIIMYNIFLLIFSPFYINLRNGWIQLYIHPLFLLNRKLTTSSTFKSNSSAFLLNLVNKNLLKSPVSFLCSKFSCTSASKLISFQPAW